jgi:hypothetical protein
LHTGYVLHFVDENVQSRLLRQNLRLFFYDIVRGKATTSVAFRNWISITNKFSDQHNFVLHNIEYRSDKLEPRLVKSWEIHSSAYETASGLWRGLTSDSVVEVATYFSLDEVISFSHEIGLALDPRKDKAASLRLLQHIITYGRLSTFQALIRTGEVKVYDRTSANKLFLIAVRRMHLDMLSYLLGLEMMRGIDMNYVHDGDTALGIAIYNFSWAVESAGENTIKECGTIVKFLIGKGATLTLYDKVDV